MRIFVVDPERTFAADAGTADVAKDMTKILTYWLDRRIFDRLEAFLGIPLGADLRFYWIRRHNGPSLRDAGVKTAKWMDSVLNHWGERDSGGWNMQLEHIIHTLFEKDEKGLPPEEALKLLCLIAQRYPEPKDAAEQWRFDALDGHTTPYDFYVSNDSYLLMAQTMADPSVELRWVWEEFVYRVFMRQMARVLSDQILPELEVFKFCPLSGGLAGLKRVARGLARAMELDETTRHRIGANLATALREKIQGKHPERDFCIADFSGGVNLTTD